MPATYRPRRSCLSVPASSERFIAKARDLPADEVFLDLEDAVAPSAKDAARGNAVAALTSGAWRAGIHAVRVNDATTPWAYQDVVALVEGPARPSMSSCCRRSPTRATSSGSTCC